MEANASRVSYLVVCGAEDYENDEYIVDEVEEEEAGYSSGESIRVTRKKRHKRLHLNLQILKVTNDSLSNLLRTFTE